MDEFPRQVGGLEISTVEDGLVVKDRGRDKVHYLNHTAGLVLILCSGKNSTHNIASLIQEQFQLEKLPENDVIEIVRQFVEEGLVHCNHD